MRRIPTCLCVLLASMLAWPSVADEVYRHVDKDGVVHYSDKPPSKKSKPVKLPPLQVVSPVALPEARSESLPSRKSSPAKVEVSIVSPKPDQTFRHPDGTVAVGVSLNPALPSGYGLFYLLDGNPQNTEPVSASSFSLSGVERGQHLITVVVVDPRGTEVARSEPVIVHMKPPTVNRPR